MELSKEGELVLLLFFLAALIIPNFFVLWSARKKYRHRIWSILFRLLIVVIAILYIFSETNAWWVASLFALPSVISLLINMVTLVSKKQALKTPIS